MCCLSNWIFVAVYVICTKAHSTCEFVCIAEVLEAESSKMIMFHHFTIPNPPDNQKLLYALLDMTAHFVSCLKNS